MAIRLHIAERLRQGQHGLAGLVLLFLFIALALLEVEPVPTYFYVLAWYPALLVVDALVVKKTGTSLLVGRPLALLCLLGWSLPFWLLFEALNMRLENWYYINAPPGLLAGRIFLVLSFATVLPGLFEVYDLLCAHGWFERARLPRFRTGPALLRALLAAGALCLVLPLLLPRLFYPLVWLFLFLLLEPFNRRPGWPSLLRDLERGQPGRLLRLLAAGLCCGLFWEAMNVLARARWIYTVPFFDRTLGVEMPPLGFLGFLPFALEAYACVRALEILGLSVPFERGAGGPMAARLHPAVRLLGLPALVSALSLLAIAGLESRSVDSTSPRVSGLSCGNRRETASLELLGLGDVRDFIAAAGAPGGIEELARRLMDDPARLERLLAEARLADLRGIGTCNACLLGQVGVVSVEALAASDPDELLAALRALGGRGERVRPERVRVWVRAAREHAGP